MSVLIAYDYSGSTCNSIHYHQITQNIVSKLKQDCRIICWNNTWKEITLDDLNRINKFYDGDGCTEIYTVADAIKKLNFTGKLILITDGQVATYSIDHCDTMMLSLSNVITSAEVHIISTGTKTNLSVSCPFTRNCPHAIYTYQNNNTYVDEVISISQDDIDTLSQIDTIYTIQEFETNYKSLLKALTARLMGKNDIDTKIHDQIVNLKNRLVFDLSKSKTNSSKSNICSLIDLVKQHDIESWHEAIKIYKNITNSHYKINSNDTLYNVDVLLNITKGGLRNEFSHRLRRAPEVEEISLDDIKLNEDEFVSDFTCPISLKSENDVAILIKHNEPIFNELDEGIIEDILNCPLNALNYKSIVNKILECFDISIGVPILIEAEKHHIPILKSPLTRDKIIGSIFLGNTESQVKATNHTISKMLTGNIAKKTGNMDLWYAVLYIILEKHERFKDILVHIENHMRWRLMNQKTYASMSGLSTYLNVKVPLGMACWMVAVAPVLQLPTKKDMSRMHIFHIEHIFKLIKCSDCFIPQDVIIKLERHYIRLTMMYKMLSICKKDNITFRMLIIALRQKCYKIDPYLVAIVDTYCTRLIEWIPIDGNADSYQKGMVLRELSEDYGINGDIYDIIGISEKVDPNLSGNDIKLDIDWVYQSTNPVIISWPGYVDSVYIDIPVCESTVRPYYIVKDMTWKDSFKMNYKMDANECISINECYIRFVQKYQKYPVSIDEFILFLYYYYVVYRYKKTLPGPILQFVLEVTDSYTKIIQKLSVKEFIKRSTESLTIIRRREMENN